MKRKCYTATVTDEHGTALTTVTKYAMNSAIGATVALVRDIARGEGVIYHGGHPSRVEQTYVRHWKSDAGRVVIARVTGPDHDQ